MKEEESLPAMLIATILISATAIFLYERPLGQPTIWSILSGIFFIDPEWVELFFKTKITPLETVFWSLYAEIRFYIIFGALYFWFRKIKAIIILFCLFLVTKILHITAMVLMANGNNISEILMPIFWFIGWHLSFGNFQWFACGTFIYQYYVERKKRYLLFYFGTVLISGIGSIEAIIIGLIIAVLFLAPFYIGKIRFLFNNKFLVFVGFISYPLYLMHSNAMIALTVKIHNHYHEKLFGEKIRSRYGRDF